MAGYKNGAANFTGRINSMQVRIHALTTIRRVVSIPASADISRRQWSVLESNLASVDVNLTKLLKQIARKYLNHLDDSDAKRKLNSLLGKMEFKLTKAYVFFDTYLDILTQRKSPELGQVLLGCDAIALDALNKEHPALQMIEPPLVYCDRGFGASIIREGISLPDHSPNPIPLIQVPYSRIKGEKYNLASVVHEAGHEMMVRLNLTKILPVVVLNALSAANAPEIVKQLFALWMFETGPDFWAFCNCGTAQAAGIRDILSLPRRQVFFLSQSDPHPTPYLRVLLSFEWCRQMWGRGVWDNWQDEWLELYPLGNQLSERLEIIKKARKYLPVVSNALLNNKLKVLQYRAMPELFSLSAISPYALSQRIKETETGIINLKGLLPSQQLAVFRKIRDQGKISEVALDDIMTEWLITIGKSRRN